MQSLHWVGAGHESVGGDMLKPREADVPALFLVLVVLPLVTYILLGKWNEVAKKKARINALAQLAAEETFRVEEIATAAITPLFEPVNTTIHECARCFRPATTRCSRCKSARYCSGKCQIIHWRQGHKQECQQPDICNSKLSASTASWESSCASSSQTENPKNLLFGFEHHEPVLESIPPNEPIHPLVTCPVANAIQHSTSERICSENWVSRTFGQENSDREDTTLYGYQEATNCIGATTLTSVCPSNFFQPSDYPQRKKSSKDNSIEASDRTPKKNNFSNHPISEQSTPQPPYRLTSKNGIGSGTINESCIPKSLYSEMRGINGNRCEINFMYTNDNYSGEELPSGNETSDLSACNENIMLEAYMGSGSPLDVSASEAFISQRPMRKGRREHPCAVREPTVAVKNKTRIPREISSEALPAESNNGILKMGGMKLMGLKKLPKLPRHQTAGRTSNNLKKNMVLFPYEELVKLFHCEVLDLHPRGLLNCGNSCYANAVLQCLTCTKPLIVYLLQRSHSRTCCGRDWCLICELELHVSMLREGAGPLSPSRILSFMQNIGCQMGGGDQEDAHEFLRLLVTSMQSICLKGFGGEKVVNLRLQETTLIQQIFGGHLRSKVKCLRCHHESERYENIMDLTLEIFGWVESLEDALTQFTSPEDLDGENMYRCERCAAYVKARKQLSIHEAPNILTIVLKRFQTGKYGKINKCITFPDILDMIPFMTGTGDCPPLYMLYGVVVHLDTLNASYSGHYVSYVKDLQGTWFRIDDAEVQPVPVGQVMSEGAYILFYSRSYPRPPRGHSGRSALMQASATAKQCPSRTQRSSRDQQSKQDLLFPQGHSPQPYYTNGGDLVNEVTYSKTSDHDLRVASSNMLPTRQTRIRTVGTDFADATSSDWSLFTSSDESSFTTESTRDSFSTVDYSETLTVDPISSIFGTYSTAEYSNGTVSSTKFSPSRPQTRYFQECNGIVLDSSNAVHKGKNLEHVTVPLNESRSSSANNCSMFVNYGTNPQNSFVRTSGCL